MKEQALTQTTTTDVYTEREVAKTTVTVLLNTVMQLSEMLVPGSAVIIKRQVMTQPKSIELPIELTREDEVPVNARVGRKSEPRDPAMSRAIRDALLNKRITQREFVKRLHLVGYDASVSAISLKLRGLGPVDNVFVEKSAQALNMKVDELKLIANNPRK